MTSLYDTVGALAVAFVIAVMVGTLFLWGPVCLLAMAVDRRWRRGR